MDRKKLSKRLILLILLISFFHYSASIFHWYTSIWLFDMPMHFSGGFFLALLSIWIFQPIAVNKQTTIKTILCVLFVGLGWEAFEFIFVNNIAQNSFNILDTVSDLFFDLAGGFAALFYFSKIYVKTFMTPETMTDNINKL